MRRLEIALSNRCAIAINDADQGHRRRVLVILIQSALGFSQREKEVAALVGAKGEVGRLAVGARRKRRRKRIDERLRIRRRCRLRDGLLGRRAASEDERSGEDHNRPRHGEWAATRASTACSDRIASSGDGASQIARSTAMKSAPALARRRAASTDSPYATHGVSNISAHQRTRSSEEFERHRRRGGARLAKHHVIGPLLACGHRVVPGSEGADADNPLRLQAVERFVERLADAFDVSAVSAQSRRQPGIAVQNQGAIRRRGLLEQRRDDRLCIAFGAGAKANTKAGDRRRRKNLRHHLSENRDARRLERRSDEVNRARRRLRRSGGHGRQSGNDLCGRPMRPNGGRGKSAPDLGPGRRSRQCAKAALNRSTWSATALAGLSTSGEQANTRLWSR